MMDTLFRLEIETGISREHYLRRPMYEILSTMKRLKEYMKEKNERENSQAKAIMNMFSFGGKKR